MLYLKLINKYLIIKYFSTSYYINKTIYWQLNDVFNFIDFKYKIVFIIKN